ncbi:hypothetical protein ACXIVK_27845 [Paraburkholderia caledonica]
MKQSKFVGHLLAAAGAIVLTATAAYAATSPDKAAAPSTAAKPTLAFANAKPLVDAHDRPLKTVGLVLHLKRGSADASSDIQMTLADRQQGFYKSEEDTPYVSSYCAPQGGSSTLSSAPGCDHDGASLSTLRTGVTVEATPVVEANGSVTLDLRITDDQLDALTNFHTPAGNLQQPLAHGNHFAGIVSLRAGIPTVVTEQSSKGEKWEVTAIIDSPDAATPTAQ